MCLCEYHTRLWELEVSVCTTSWACFPSPLRSCSYQIPPSLGLLRCTVAKGRLSPLLALISFSSSLISKPEAQPGCRSWAEPSIALLGVWAVNLA